MQYISTKIEIFKIFWYLFCYAERQGVEEMIQKFIKEPFFHFIALGALIYLVFTLVHPSQKEEKNFSLSPKVIEALQIKWKKAYKREATPKELESLILKKKQDAKLFEEALAMGLPKKDLDIYKKLIEEVKFQLANSGLNQMPDEKELEVYYTKHLENYSKNGNFSFSHIFISTEHDNPIQDADALLVLLRETDVRGEDIKSFGDDFSPRDFENASADDIEKIFGKSFYKQLNHLKMGRWSEPIISIKGIHLVFINGREHAEILPYSEVKGIVKSDYIEDAKQAQYRKRLQSLMQ